MSTQEGSVSPAGTQGGAEKFPPLTEDGSRMKVHNADLFVELMQSNDWGTKHHAGEKCVKEMKANEKKKDGSRISANDRAKKSREAFVEKQSLRDHEFKMKLDVARKEGERKSKERAERKEKAFEAGFENFQETNRRLAEEVEGAITADELWRQRKKERLYNEWTLKVFQPMQDQINNHISSMTQQEVEERRRAMFQSFLDESNKKTNGLFRDIVIESDYDPLHQAQSSTIKYSKVSLAEDPTKNRATRELHDNRTKGLIMHVANANSKGGPATSSVDRRPAVSVQQWANMEATPYGRYSNEDSDPNKRKSKPTFMKSSIKPDHYSIPSGGDGMKLLREENNVKGKRIVKPPFLVKSQQEQGNPLGGGLPAV